MIKKDKKLNYDVGIVGLGYVGLTLGAAFAKSGLKVLGVEKRKDIVSLVSKGKAHFAELGLEQILTEQVNNGNLIAKNKFESSDHCRHFIITVGTPLDAKGKPRLDMIKSAVSDIINQIKDGSIIIVRSTVQIGTTRNCVDAELKKTKKKYLLAMCPERTLEGNAIKELNILPQIIGSDDRDTFNKVSKLFMRLTNSIIYVDSYEAAEIIKLVDNTYRDVQFGFANEVARICDAVGVNTMEVIRAGKQNYPRTNVALPGLVGGPCLEKDPHIFNHSANKYGIDLKITKAARFVNENHPIEVISKLINRCSKNKSKNNLKITFLGMAFKGKPTTDDLRGSMATFVLKEFQKKIPKINIGVYDPIVSSKKLKSHYPKCSVFESIYDAVTGADLVMITNNNEVFSHQNLNKLISLLSPNGFIFDFWNNFSTDPTVKYNEKYLSLGNFKNKRQ